MKQIMKRRAAVVLLAAFAMMSRPGPSWGQGGTSPLMPPQSHAFGKSLQEWSVLQAEYALRTGLGGASNLGNTVDGVRLLPGDFANSVAVFDVTLAPGTPFVAVPFFLFGERYDDPNVPADNPADLAPVLEQIFSTLDVQIVLDGRTLLKGTGAELKRFMFAPTALEAPVEYAQPQPRGPGLNGVAALWVTGFGAVYRPLPVGQHTLVYIVESEFTGAFQFTYNITVTPK